MFSPLSADCNITQHTRYLCHCFLIHIGLALYVVFLLKILLRQFNNNVEQLILVKRNMNYHQSILFYALRQLNIKAPNNRDIRQFLVFSLRYRQPQDFLIPDDRTEPALLADRNL